MSATAVQPQTIDSRVLKVNLLIISWTGVAGFVLLLRHGMSFDFSSAATAMGTIALLSPFAVIFDRRGIAPFVNLLTGFLCMVAFNVFLSILTYAGTPLNAPLADGWLMKIDAALGIHLPSIVAWTATYPVVQTIFDAVYPSVMLSTLLALIVLGLDKEHQKMQDFVLQFMLAGLLTTMIFFLLPAAGPFATYGFELRADQQRFLDHFDALRSGRFRQVSLNHLEGLITFPSFHTAWALLLAWSFRQHRWLKIPMLILNLMVVVSTLTTGWHYGTDVIGGFLVALTAAVATKRLRPYLQSVSLSDEEAVDQAISDSTLRNTSARQTAL